MLADCLPSQHAASHYRFAFVVMHMKCHDFSHLRMKPNASDASGISS